MKPISFLLSAFAMAISLPLSAQLTYTRISTATVYTCPCPLPGQVVHVPVTVKNFKPISSVSFKIRFANANLEWAGYQDLHPDLPPSLVYHSPGMSYNDINIVAFSVTGCFSIPDDDTLIVLRFIRLNCNPATLVWDTATMPAQWYGCYDTLAVHYMDGMITPGTASITFHPSDTSVPAGMTATFSCQPFLAGLTALQWQESTDHGITWTSLSDNAIYSGTLGEVLTISTSAAMNGNNYRCLSSGFCDADTSNAALLGITCPTLSGKILYDNTLITPLTQFEVDLYGANTFYIGLTWTDSLSGFFEFPCLDDDTYSLNIVSSLPWSAGAVNAADGLMILKHFTGMITLSGLRLQAADVDGSGFVNATDALLVLQRFVGLINNFPASDWIFDTSGVLIQGSDIFLDIRGMLRGDVDGSFIP